MVCDETATYTKPVLQLLKASGSCEIISEEWMNACSATSGSGPAYVSFPLKRHLDAQESCNHVQCSIQCCFDWLCLPVVALSFFRPIDEQSAIQTVYNELVCSLGNE